MKEKYDYLWLFSLVNKVRNIYSVFGAQMDRSRRSLGVQFCDEEKSGKDTYDSRQPQGAILDLG